MPVPFSASHGRRSPNERSGLARGLIRTLKKRECAPILPAGGRWFGGSPSTQRIDKWLWFARVVKTRSLAARLVEAGHVRVNGRRTDNAAKTLRAGDVLTIALERQVRLLRVVADGDRRGPSAEASLLFEDLESPCGDTAS